MKFCAFLLGFVACIGGCSAKDASDPYATVADFCTAWGKAACNSTVVSHCSGMTTTSALTDACVSTQQTFCEGLVSAHPGYSSAQAQACIDAVGHAYQDAMLTGAEISVVTELGGNCNHLFKGTAAKGATCNTDFDCDTVHNVQCVMKSGVGTCVVPTVVANGTSCSAPESACMPGFFCDGAHCVQSEAVGDKCTADYECGTGLSCDTTTSKCATRVDPSMCAANADCTTGVCDIVGTASTGACVDSIVLARAESMCEALR